MLTRSSQQLNAVPHQTINNNSAKHENYKNNIVLLTIGKYALCRCQYYKSLIRNRVAFFACIYVLGCLFSAIYRKRFVATS